MLQNLSIPPHRIQHITCITGAPPGRNKPFPLLTIDEDSYIAGAEVYSGLDFDPDAGRYCLAIGKGCSLAEGITFLIDLDHDFHSVSQGELSCLQGMEKTWKTRRRASIILQNDVWVGHGATIMAGVTLHNGCIAAANAVVTKDIPPYAIAGGNPARILGYRFDEETIAALQRIAWWDWPKETRLARRADFDLPVQAFIERCLLYKDIERKYVPPPAHSWTHTRCSLHRGHWRALSALSRCAAAIL